MFAFLKFVILIFLMGMAFFWQGSVSVNIAGFTADVQMWLLIAIFAVFCYLYNFFVWIFKRVISFFSGAPNHEKGLESLQEAFSALLLKDISAVAARLKRAKKYLGDIPIISWLEGQFNLINGDEHRAKSIFYSLCDKEKHTAFGAYSLSQLAIKNGSNSDALNALDAVLKVQPRAEEFIKQAISIALKSKNFSEAKKHANRLEKSSDRDLMNAVILYEESLYTDDKNAAKKAFKLAPHLEQISLHYAGILQKEREYRDAKKVIMQTFEVAPTRKLFAQYVNCGEQLSIKDKMQSAEKLTYVAPESWIAYFGLAEIEMQEKMYLNAFQNLLVAYSKEQYDFIAELLTDVAEKLEEPKPLSAKEILSRTLDSKSVNFVWQCSVCGREESEWKSICDYCNHVATFNYVEREETKKIQLESKPDFL